MNSVPLADALPWEPTSPPAGGRTILVADSCETSGRFLLHVLASQFLSSSSSSETISGGVLWLSCGPSTERQIASGLKRAGCDAASSYLRAMPSDPLPPDGRGGRSGGSPAADGRIGGALRIISIASEVTAALDTVDFEEEDPTGSGGLASKVGEKYLKGVYKRVRTFFDRQKDSGTSETKDARGGAAAVRRDLIVVDDVSLLATCFGERLAYAFVHKLRTTVRRRSGVSGSVSSGCALVLRCSHDVEQDRYLSRSTADDGHKTNVKGGSHDTLRPWVGAGGSGDKVAVESHAASLVPTWEASFLVELADGIIDVVPLISGYAREAHGRLVFTAREGGRGWGEGAGQRKPSQPGSRITSSAATFSTTVVNYCCEDNGAKAIRLRTGR